MTTMSATQHSPTPWELVGDKGGICRVGDQFNDVIIRSVRNVTSDDKWRATAAFIVRACNAHDGLVDQRDTLLAACENVVLGLKDVNFGKHNNWYRDNTVNILRGAIALAKGEA